MTTSLIVGERPLPVVLQPARDEFLSSWLRRHVAFYRVTEPIFASWLRLGTKNLRSLDGRLDLGQVARIVEKFRCDPNTVLEMTHAPLPAEFAPLVRSSRPSQFCRSCWDRHLAADAQGVVMKSWREGGVSLARCAARRCRRATGLAAATIRSATRALFQRTGTPRGKEKTSSIGI